MDSNGVYLEFTACTWNKSMSLLYLSQLAQAVFPFLQVLPLHFEDEWQTAADHSKSLW